ncbi:hypothetical protein [Klebsiella spallanzanii]|nr:hypothetical protein [Klebsiella spallanzanii]
MAARPGTGKMTPRKGIRMRIFLLLLMLCGLPAFADQTQPVIDTLTAVEQKVVEGSSIQQPDAKEDLFEALADHLLADLNLTLPCFIFTLLMMAIIIALYRFGGSIKIIGVISLATISIWSFVLREDVIIHQVGNISLCLLITLPLWSRLKNIVVSGRMLITSITGGAKGKKKKASSKAGKKHHKSSSGLDSPEVSKNRKKTVLIVLAFSVVAALIVLLIYLDIEWLKNAASRFAEFLLTVVVIVIIVLSGGFKSGGGGGSSGSSSGGGFRGGGGSSGGGGASGRW